jgi:hypothetical protein
MIHNINKNISKNNKASRPFDLYYLNRNIFKIRNLKGKSILQVGARPGGGWHKLFEVFKNNGYLTFHILEAHEPNVEKLKNNNFLKGEGKKIVCGDVRKINEYEELKDKYDTIVFWHGPEHLEEEDFKKALPLIMSKCRKVFIVGAPWGKWEQSGIKNNPHELHKKHWYPEELEQLGFECYTFNYSRLGEGPDKYNVMFGIKFVDGIKAEI